MEFILKKFDRSDRLIVDMIKAWWGAKVGAILSDAVLTDSGYLILDDMNQPLVASFLYPIQGCEAALIGFPIANPKLDKALRHKSIHLLTTSIEKEAKKLNYRFLVSYAGSKGAVDMFNREGYKVYDKEVVNFGKVL